MKRKILKHKEKPILVVNQSIGKLFADLTTKLKESNKVEIFKSIEYNRSNYFLRLFSWLFFSVQLGFHLIFNGKRYKGILISSNPPFAPLLAPLCGVSYSLLLYDLYPQVISQINLPNFCFEIIKNIWNCFNRYSFSNTSMIFTLSDEMADELKLYFRSESEWEKKISVIPPWINYKKTKIIVSKKNDFREGLEVDQRFLVVYCGNIGLTHPLEYIVEAASILEDDSQFLMIGNGQKRKILERYTEKLGISNRSLRFLNPLSEKDFDLCNLTADIAIVAIDGPASMASLPSKTFTSLASGTPIIAISPKGSTLCKLVNKYNCGLSVEPNQDAPKNIIKAIRFFKENPLELSKFSNNAYQASSDFSDSNAYKLIKIFLKKIDKVL